jgi:hypothetical protein
MMRMLIVPLASLGVLVATDGTALAGKSDHGFIGQTGRVEPHARYQNDVAYEFGTVSKRGSKTIPYVERCTWTAEPGWFFIKGLKQVCTRYTLENTE